MFCPKCAAHNTDDARFCRVCGADISLLPQVLSGQLTADLSAADETAVEKISKRRKRKEKSPPTLEKAFENIGVGIAFLIISVMIALFMPGGRLWWFWMLIPALACAGEGIGQLMRVKNEKVMPAGREPLLPASREVDVRSLPPRNTSEIMMPPPSVTERTTRHLNMEPQKRDASESVEPPERTLDSNLK